MGPGAWRDGPRLRHYTAGMDTPVIAPAKPAASVVIVRDGSQGLEVLLVQRNEKIAFHGGAWVFPGGRVDAADRLRDEASELEIAREAAAREAQEEAGLALSPTRMHFFSHWTTPVDLPKRFATWFFAAPLEQDSPVTVDNSEIVAHRWVTPEEALVLQRQGEMVLPAPTFVTLLRFRPWTNTAALFGHLGDAPVQHFVPRLVPVEGGRCALYQEDAGYPTHDLHAPGARHRLLMIDPDWHYQREF